MKSPALKRVSLFVQLLHLKIYLSPSLDGKEEGRIIVFNQPFEYCIF